jgi:hypothetical protein
MKKQREWLKLPTRIDDVVQRLFEIIPGFSIWLIILSPFWAGLALPDLMAMALIALAVFWLYRAFMTTVGTTLGLVAAQRAVQQDWLKKCLDLKRYDLPESDTLPVGQFLPKHLLVYPQRVPQLAVLRSTLAGIQAQNYPKELLYIAISFERRAAKHLPEGEIGKLQDELRQAFPDLSPRLYFFEHPDDIEGEAIGAGPNRAWGAKNAVAQLEQDGEVISDFLVTSPDEDIVFHPQFLAACSYQYLTAEKRQRKFYQTALYTFNNNYWQVPILIRVVAASLTLPVLSSSIIEKHKRETFSCYTLSLEVLRAVNYWDTSYGIDDTTFYWRPFFYFKGDWECEVFYVPLMADAIYDTNYIQNHREQYKQYVRWGWGVIAFPIGMKGLLTVPGIPLFKRLEKLLVLFEVFIFWKVLAYLLTFALPIILFLNPQLTEFTFWYRAPQLLSNIMGLAVIFLVPNTIYKALLAPAKPDDMPMWRYIGTLVLEAPLNIISLFIYSTFPFVEASTRLMVGQRESKSVIWSTKVRK